MPRCPRLSSGGLAYHVLNRRVGRLPLFKKPFDYLSFQKILHEAHERAWHPRCRILSGAQTVASAFMVVGR